MATYAVSLWQPWATLIVLGQKRVETRHWPAPHSIIGERIAIHAAKKTDHLGLAKRDPFSAALAGRELPLGMLVGTVVVLGSECMTADFCERVEYPESAFGHFALGRFAWHLTDAQPLHAPIAWRGQQGVFSIPSDVVGLSPVAPGQERLL